MITVTTLQNIAFGTATNFCWNGYKSFSFLGLIWIDKIALISIFLILTFISCNKNDQNSHNCIYKKYDGKAKVISITTAPANENNCPLNPQRVIFVFTPYDTTVKNNYIFKNWSDTSALTINGNVNPSQNFLDSLDITIGKEFSCNRKEIIQGTCNLVGFEFTTINLNPENGCR